MSHNTFGTLFRFTTWGESHGPALGCVVDGTPPGIALSEADIQLWLDKRKPGQSRNTTQRREPDAVHILSGVFEGRTTGTPISLMIENVDQRSKDYGDIAEKFRPGHADYTYTSQIRLPRLSRRRAFVRARDRGAGRGRRGRAEGPRRVASRSAGALVQIGDDPIDRDAWDWDEVANNPVLVARRQGRRALGSDCSTRSARPAARSAR